MSGVVQPVTQHFAALCDARASADPDGAAVGDAEIVLTNQQLLERVVAAGSYLREHGANRGDVVALRLPNGLNFVILLLAAWRIGCTVTPVNPGLKDDELQHQLDDSGASVLVDVDGSTPSRGPAVIASEDVPTTGGERDLRASLDSSSLALLIYTSGTTGRPKGVMLTHQNVMAMASTGAQSLAITSADRSLLILPLFHVNGIVVSVLVPLLHGGSTIIAGRFDPATFLELVERTRATYFSGVPTIYAMLAATAQPGASDTSSLRFALCGAAPAPPGVLEAFEERFGFPVVEGYGLSEGTCASTVNPWDGLRKQGTVGLPMPGQQVRVVDGEGAEVGAGVTGEVQIKGANVMAGYLGRPRETEAVLVDGWLLTGDLGHLDEDGYLVIDGRVKDMIIRGGENIYPREIEDVLTRHPHVADAAVVGRPDPTWGEIVIAFVAADPGVDTAQTFVELEELCQERLAPFKRPAVIWALPSLPLNPVGKVDKRKLRSVVVEAATAGGTPRDGWQEHILGRPGRP